MYPIRQPYVAALCICLSGACFATEQPIPEPHICGISTYVTGAVGSSEVNSFRVIAQQYNLRITFSSATDEYYAGVKVTLRDSEGKTLIETISDGPFVFFNVLPGKYEVVAENLGQTITHTAEVREKRCNEILIRWKGLSKEQTE